MAYVMYADEAEEWLPYGVRNALSGVGFRQGIPHMIPTTVMLRLNEYGAFAVMACPNAPRTAPDYVPSYDSYILGIANLAGHELPSGATWTSPRTLKADSALALSTDFTYRNGGTWGTYYTHRTASRNGINIDPRILGMAGQNVAYLNGSVSWVSVKNLRQHKGYYNRYNDGTRAWVPDASGFWFYF
jgi:hypothetical protein